MKNATKLLALVGVALLVPAAGCNDPLRVTIPDIVTPGQLNDSSALATLRAGAIGDFAVAYTGDHPDGSGGTGASEGVIMYGGLLADEWINSETFPTRIEVDGRTIHATNSDVDLWFRKLHQSRRSAEIAAGRYASSAPDDAAYPELLTLAGFTYVFFAETYCSGVPISQLNPDGTITYGRPLTTSELLDTAIARFDVALTAAAALDTSGATAAARAPKVALRKNRLDFASVGKARALLDLGQFATAGTVAASVASSFVYVNEHSENTDRENNGVFNGNVVDKRYAVADREGTNGFPFRSVVDPRTPFVRPSGAAGVGFDRATPQWNNLRYGSRSAPVTVATGVEARLIEAEVAYRGGDSTGVFLTDLNEPRGNASERAYFDPTGAAPGIGVLAPLTLADETTAGGAVNLLFAERARWLWLTAHRLGDLRRLIRQYGRPADTLFPVGTYFKASFSYGVDVNIPVPITEQNNPSFSGCLDRNP